MSSNILKGHPNNKYNVALPTMELRKIAYEKFCEHIGKGKAIESWYYDDGEYVCSYKTMLSYINESPSDFPSSKREIAKSNGYQYWESVAEQTANGKNKKACVPALNMIMRNKYGWDKILKEDDAKRIYEDAVKKSLAERMNAEPTVSP